MMVKLGIVRFGLTLYFGVKRMRKRCETNRYGASKWISFGLVEIRLRCEFCLMFTLRSSDRSPSMFCRIPSP